MNRRSLLAAGVLGVPVVAMGGLTAAVQALAGPPPQPAMTGYGGGAGTDIPPELLPLFQAAGQRHGVSWALLAAVGYVESGAWSPDVIACQRNSSAGAQGVMQFMPGTARRMGIDPCDPAQAIDGAARYLREMHAMFGTVELALAAYNGGPGAVQRGFRAAQYVADVLAKAAEYLTAGAMPVMAVSADARAVVSDSRIVMTQRERRDLLHPQMDPRVVALLAAMASRWPRIGISVVKTGHYRCVGGGDYPGCHQSLHWTFQAADVYMVGGQRVSVGNESARQAVASLAAVQGPMRPSEVGSPFAEFSALPGFFTDASHMGHLHLGYD